LRFSEAAAGPAIRAAAAVAMVAIRRRMGTAAGQGLFARMGTVGMECSLSRGIDGLDPAVLPINQHHGATPENHAPVRGVLL